MFSTSITSEQFLKAIIETIQMVGVSLFVGSLLGVPLGILLVITRPGGYWRIRRSIRCSIR